MIIRYIFIIILILTTQTKNLKAMFFKHIYDTTLAQGSYMIGCQVTGEAIVIDAKRDVDTYLEIAKNNGLNITHITETHIHADFLSGSRELAQLTGAKMYLSDEGSPDWQYEFDHIGLKHGDAIQIGNVSLEVIHTPGHTPESISFLLTDNPASDQPSMIFTGDFVFVGDVGRPDLLEKAAGIKNTQEKGARDLWKSLKEFSKLPHHIQLWPGHGAGSACGKSLGSIPSSTVGYELISNWAFKYLDDEEGFVKELLSGQPEPPKYFAMMKKLNKVDRKLLTTVPQHQKMNKEEFLNEYNQGVRVIDTRNRKEFATAHIPNSYHILGNDSFSTWAGWIMNYDENIILVADGNQMDDLTRKLMRIGLDNIIGYIDQIDELGLKLESNEIIDIDQFKEYLSKDNVQVCDVRSQNEYTTKHIEGAKHLFLGTIKDNLDKLDPSKEIVIHCQSGARAAIAHSILSSEGFKNIKNFEGGMNEWNKNDPATCSL